MASTLNTKGTTQQSFKIGKGDTAPLLKAGTSALAMRNASDSDYVYIRCKNPVAAQDAVTLTYLQSNNYTKTESDAKYIPIIAAPTLYRIPFVNAAGKLTESSSILTDSNGYLGVGVTPFYSLHVLNSALTSTTPAANIIMRLQANASGADVNIQLSDGVSNSTRIGMVGGSLYFRTSVGEVGRFDRLTSALLINATVAQGTEKFHVTGNSYFNGNVSVVSVSTTLTTALLKGKSGQVEANPILLVQRSNGVSLFSVTQDHGISMAADLKIAAANVIKVNDLQVIGVRQAYITDPTGGATVDAESRTAITSILSALETHGLLASA